MTKRDAINFLRFAGLFFGGTALTVAISAVIGLDLFIIAIISLLPFVVGALSLQERHGRWPYNPAKH